MGVKPGVKPGVKLRVKPGLKMGVKPGVKLSLLVGHYGNTALHLASARGHFDCVDFLVKFGVNIFSLDIDMHTSKELAAMNDCPEILR